MSLLILLQTNLKKFWPQFPRDKKPVAGSIVSNSIQHAFFVRGAACLTQSRKVDPSIDAPGIGIDARNALVVPNIREDFALDEFHFIQTVDHATAVQYADGFPDGERFRIEEANPMATIGEYQ